MSKFFKHAGTVCLRRDASDEALAPIPAEATDVVVFDGEANADVIADYSRNHNAYRLTGGVLTKLGAPVPLVPDGPDKQARDGLKSAAQAINANKAFLAISFPTAQQAANQTKELTKQMNAVIRRLVLMVKETGRE